jgi:hypothetical protein
MTNLKRCLVGEEMMERDDGIIAAKTGHWALEFRFTQNAAEVHLGA